MEDTDRNALFRAALIDELSRRTKRNQNYSIRSFAQFLGVEPSSLAQILSGKRTLTDKMCDRLGKKLGFGPQKLKALKRTPLLLGKNRFECFRKIEEDRFKVISDWYYYAILELTYCEGFKPSVDWVSKVLGIPLGITEEAVERLKRLGHLEILDGKWVDRLGDALNVGNEVKAQAFTEHQRQVLTKAIAALDCVPFEKRTQTSITVAVSRERALEAKKLILAFVEELNEFLRSGPSTDEVYNLSVSLYPVSDQAGGNA